MEGSNHIYVMMMKFKTNLKCNGCVQSIRPNLDSMKEIREWSVDLDTPERTLTIKGESLDAEKIIAAVEAAGYKAVRTE